MDIKKSAKAGQLVRLGAIFLTAELRYSLHPERL